MNTLEEKIQSARQRGKGLAKTQECPYRSMADLMLLRQQLGEKTWLVYYDEHNLRSEYSYKEFVDLARRTASLLAKNNIGRGDRIAIMGHNHPDTIVQYFAAWFLGCCVVPLNMSEDNERLAYILENSLAKAIFCREEYLDRCNEVLPQDFSPTIIVVYDSPDCPDGFHRRIAAEIPTEFTMQDMLEDEALIVYTSGTTGNPKGVLLVQKNIFADAMNIASWHRIDETTRMMCVLPVHHVNGCVVTHATPFYAGGSVVLNRKFQTERFFERITKEGVEIVSVVPTLLAFLLQSQSNSAEAAASGLRHIICGAGPLTCELAKKFWDMYSIRIVHGYGLSETTCYSCFLPLNLSDLEYQTWMFGHGFPSIGVPLDCNDMQIHTAEGLPLPEGERGEIVVRGDNVMKGYYKNISANAEAFAYGWFRSGDEGFFLNGADGLQYFFITGRIKELIIRGGVNLAPLEIDEIVNRAPGVKAGIAVGFENNFYGEEVGALIVPEKAETSKENILKYCAEFLPFHKQPKAIVFVDALPVTSTGKYQRNKVKHLFSSWKDVQFRKEK